MKYLASVSYQFVYGPRVFWNIFPHVLNKSNIKVDCIMF